MLWRRCSSIEAGTHRGDRSRLNVSIGAVGILVLKDEEDVNLAQSSSACQALCELERPGVLINEDVGEHLLYLGSIAGLMVDVNYFSVYTNIKY